MFIPKKRIYLTSKLKCTIWHRNETHCVRAKKSNTWFNQVVRDCVNDVKRGSFGYCFDYEQLEEIKRKLKNECNIVIKHSAEQGVYYIRKLEARQ